MTRYRIGSLALTLALALAASGCGGTEEVAPAAEPDGGEASAPAEEPTPELADDSGLTPPDAAPAGNPLLDPDLPEANLTAPDEFRVTFATTKGDFVVEVHRDWAPLGADRFYNLVSIGYYDGTRFFRVLDGFIAQFGMNGDPAVNEAWDMASIRDDPQGEMNVRGRVTFAHGGADTRTTQLFINLGDNLQLDTMGFPPFGEVIEGMGVVTSLYSGYGEGAPNGSGPSQTGIGAEGNTYLDREYPLLDYIESARITGER